MRIINWLNGKKTTIATILGAILVFAIGRDWLAQDTAQLISVILAALGLGINVYNASERAKGNR